MNIINYQNNKTKNFLLLKTNQKDQKIQLPCLKVSLTEKRCKKFDNFNKKPKNKINNICIQGVGLTLQKNEQKKLYEYQLELKNFHKRQQDLLKMHKPYSGNPSLKFNNNINDLTKQPYLYQDRNILDREILTANPSFLNINNNNKNDFTNTNLKLMQQPNNLFFLQGDNTISKSSPKYNLVNNLIKSQCEKFNKYDKVKSLKMLKSFENGRKIKKFGINIDLKNVNNFNKLQFFNNNENKFSINTDKFNLIPKKLKFIKSASDINITNFIYNNKLNKNMKYLSKNNSNNNFLSDNIKETNNTNEFNINIKNNSTCFISYAYNEYPNLEHRPEMQDFHCIKKFFGKNLNQSYFAIFDGHGGKDVAEYLSLNFHKFLINELNYELSEKNISKIENSIKIAFQKIDNEILLNPNISNNIGSTATIIFIYNFNQKNRILICANIGDSKGYLITKNNIKLITKEHKCDDLNEVKRIKESGGLVFQGRVYGTLMLTRSLGDKEMKKYGVIPLPDFYVKKIDEKDIFCVIGSDGIWDVIEEEELLNISKEKISSDEFAKKIIKISEERDTRDNASCIVIKLNIC